jgi:hypothetical protein
MVGVLWAKNFGGGKKLNTFNTKCQHIDMRPVRGDQLDRIKLACAPARKGPLIGIGTRPVLAMA